MDRIRRLAVEQRRRLVAAILSHAEASFRDRLTDEEWRELREKVMASVGVYHDFMLDVIKTGDDDVQNELAQEVRQLVHLVRLERSR